MREFGLLQNTLYLVLAVGAIAIPWGTWLAWVLSRSPTAWGRTALIGLSSLLFIPLFLQAAGWDAGLGRQGWLSLQHGNVHTPILEGWRAAIWIHAVAALPWVVLIVGLALRFVEPELEEAALLDGSLLQVAWTVTLRRALTGLLVAGLWVAVLVTGEMTVTDLYQVRTYAGELYRNVPSLTELPEQGELTPLTLILGTVLLTGMTLAALARVVPREFLPTLRPGQAGTYPLHRSRLQAILLTMLVGFTVALVVGVPVGNLMVNGGIEVRPTEDGFERTWSGWRLLQLGLQSPGRFSHELAWSLVISSLAAFITVSLATPLAWWARRSTWAWGLLIGSVSLALAIPGPLIGLTIIGLLNRDSLPLLIWLYDRSILAPLLAVCVRAWPIVGLISWYAWRSLPQVTLDAGELDGARGWSSFLRLGWPQRRLAVGVATLAAVAIGCGDLSATILVTPPGLFTVSSRVFGLLHAGVDDQTAGLCLTLWCLFLSFTGLIAWGTAHADKPH